VADGTIQRRGPGCRTGIFGHQALEYEHEDARPLAALVTVIVAVMSRCRRRRAQESRTNKRFVQARGQRRCRLRLPRGWACGLRGCRYGQRGSLSGVWCPGPTGQGETRGAWLPEQRVEGGSDSVPSRGRRRSTTSLQPGGARARAARTCNCRRSAPPGYVHPTTPTCIRFRHQARTVGSP
jgi:hypothetical protein